ncbi:MAG: substrate-binding domain-containing protein [Oscillospiraceae bacterium]|jgi:ABC-type sugar transport system substrate-binding protein|nr:substrate-binding domain-containing protein [Oscillospiraceae bacterium]
MKKLISLLLTALLVFSIAACGKESPAEPAATPSAPSETAETPPAPTDGAPENTAPDVPAPATGTVGYITDEVDHSARDTYEIAYVYHQSLQMCHDLFIAMQAFESKLNIHVTEYVGNSDNDKFIATLETVAMKGVDGIVTIIDASITDRAYEVLESLGVPYVVMWNGAADENGRNLAPVVMIDDHVNGATQTQFLYDQYKTYWGDIDVSKLGLLTIEFSGSPELSARSQGSKDKFKELFPNSPSFVADLVSSGFGAEYALDQAQSIISANSDVEYWFIAGVVDEFGQGAVRAAEQLGKTDKVLVVSSGANVIKQEWDNGYDGCWIGAFAVSDYYWVAPPLCGVIALIDGRAEQETLWAERKSDGDLAAKYKLGGGNDMMTKANYKSITDVAKADLGI